MAASTSTSPWPPREGLSTPTVSRKDAILTTTASIQIQAPAARVFGILLDAASYENWNTWIPKVSIQSQPEGISKDDQKLRLATLFTFHVIMDAKKPNNDTPTMLRISDISMPEQQSGYIGKEMLEGGQGYTQDLSKVYRVAWKSEGGFVSRGLKAERFHEVIVIGEDECEVRTWEVMGGVLAYTVRWMYAKTLSEKFVLWCNDLKEFCEQ